MHVNVRLSVPWFKYKHHTRAIVEKLIISSLLKKFFVFIETYLQEPAIEFYLDVDWSSQHILQDSLVPSAAGSRKCLLSFVFRLEFCDHLRINDPRVRVCLSDHWFSYKHHKIFLLLTNWYYPICSRNTPVFYEIAFAALSHCIQSRLIRPVHLNSASLGSARPVIYDVVLQVGSPVHVYRLCCVLRFPHVPGFVTKLWK
jgi:hypothetical protein